MKNAFECNQFESFSLDNVYPQMGEVLVENPMGMR